VNFDAFDQAADDLAFRYEIDSAQSVMDSSGKLFETINHEKQLVLTHLMTPRLLKLLINLFQAVLQVPHLRIKVRFVDHTLGITIDEPRLAFIQLQSLSFQCGSIRICFFFFFEDTQSAFIFTL
jgi:hypothetical protein